MKPFKDYETTKAYSESSKLPKGGYVLKILGVTEEKASNGNMYLKLMCDICEGEYFEFFMNKWNETKTEDKKWGCNFTIWEPLDDGTEKDGWTKRSFKTAIEAIEDSNEGFHWDWDEKKLKGLIVGGLFNEKEWEYEGKGGMKTNLAKLVKAEVIHSGDYTLPEDKFLNTLKKATSTDGFMQIPDNVSDAGLPFA